MRGRTTDQYIAAPVERVYAAYVDPVLMPTWMELQEVIDLTGPLDRAGTQFTQVYRGPWRFRTRVVQASPPVLHEMAGRAPLATTYRWLTRFAPEAQGTRVTVQSTSRAFGVLDPLAQLVFGASSEAEMRRHLAALAALVEARVGDGR